MERFDYPVLLKAAKEGGFIVTCRDLPSLITQGEDKADAMSQAADAMDEVFATYMLEGLTFPTPSKPRRYEYSIAPPAETMAKAALYIAMSEAGITKVQLARQLGVDKRKCAACLTPTMVQSCRASHRPYSYSASGW